MVNRRPPPRWSHSPARSRGSSSSGRNGAGPVDPQRRNDGGHETVTGSQPLPWVQDKPSAAGGRRLFIYAKGTGASLSCTVTVDGRVTAQDSGSSIPARLSPRPSDRHDRLINTGRPARS